MAKDYYVVLGVSKGADLNRIKKAYRSVAKEVHPDVAGDRRDSARFLEIREAYETLTDEARRRRYDAELEKEKTGVSITRVSHHVGTETGPFKDPGRFFTETDDFFAGFLPGFFDLHKGRIGAKDLYYEAVLSPEEAAHGGLFPVSVPVLEPCPGCEAAEGIDRLFCPLCKGCGAVRSSREFSLSIPPHVADGTEIRISLEDIGLRRACLNVLVRIDPYLDEPGS